MPWLVRSKDLVISSGLIRSKDKTVSGFSAVSKVLDELPRPISKSELLNKKCA